MYKKYGLYINGKWRSATGSNTSDVFSPVTEASLGEVPAASVADSDEAIASAALGFEKWRALSAFDRADRMHLIATEMANRADEGAVMISTETGKPLAQSGREWSLAVDQFRWYAEEARRIYGRIIESRAPGGRLEVHREPVGICAAFTAWNFPAALVARKVAPALAAGCSVIIRPSSQTPGVAMVIVDCIRAAGLPDGVVSLLTGPTSQTYEPIMASALVRKVSLTGSTQVGQQMIRDAAATMKKVSMELGGNAPLIVFEDADLEAALDIIVPSKFGNCGQVCVAPDRFFIHESLHDAFVAGFVQRTERLKIGDGLDQSVHLGPLIAARGLQATEAIIADAIEAGAEIATGGHRVNEFSKGHFHQPTVLVNVPGSARAMAQENFGPIAAITRFSSAEDVYSRANSSDMGLSAYAFTQSAKRAREAVAELKSGMVGINSFALAGSEAPFGGTKYSGMGREGGPEGIEDYLDTKLAQMTF